MKKQILVLVVSLLASVANAKLSSGCQQSMAQKAANYKDAFTRFVAHPDLFPEAYVTPDEARSIVVGWDSVARMTALRCAGIKREQLKGSITGYLGLVSESRATQASEAVYAEAMNYYEYLKTQ